MAVAADHPAQVSAPVVGVLLGRLGERTDAHELVAHGQVRPLERASFGTGDILPAASGCQKPVVSAGDQAGAVRQRDTVGGLDH